MGERLQGRRIPDGELPERPGEYARHVVTVDGADDVRWFFVPPSGGSLAGISASVHFVEENPDGTISNSIAVQANAAGPGWHGYIYDGVWESV